MNPRIALLVAAGCILGDLLLAAGPTLAAEPPERTIVIKEHRFDPATVEVPAGVRVKLIIDNQDATPEEFESRDLRREKVVAGKSKGIVWVGPLPKGEYGFFGDFHQKTAQGKLVAK
jgi:plastocyanin